MRRFFLLLCAVLLAVGACLPIPARAEGRELTLMVYMCGSNLESNDGAATRDITEMLRSGYNTDKITVLVMTGGSPYWFGGFSEKNTTIYELRGKRPAKVWDSKALSMGDPDTLSTLVRFGYTEYPAEKYALVLWDHGGGPVRGCCSDTLFHDGLSLQELQQALEQSPAAGQKLEWIGFDACLMASLEIASTVSAYAKYMIASEETEPGSGWDYRFLKGVEQDASGAETGRRIVDHYFDSLAAYPDDLTLSCIDLNQIPRLCTAVNTVYDNLTSDMSQDTLPDYSSARSAARSFGRSADSASDFDLVDLLDLTQNYSDLEAVGAWQVRNALRRAVVYSRSSMDGCCGLSVYHPFYNVQAYRRDIQTVLGSQYTPLGFRRYIYRFQNLIARNTDAPDWSELSTGTALSAWNGSQWFSLRLSEEQKSSFLSARFLVLGHPAEEEDTLALLFSTGNVRVSDSGYISGRYYGQGLYLVDNETGDILGGPLYGVRAMPTGEYVVNVLPEQDYLTPDSICRDVQLWFTVDEDNVLQLKSVQTYDETIDAYTARQNTDLSVYPSLIFPNTTITPIRNENGTLTVDWFQSVSSQTGWQITNYDWHLEFRSEPIEDMELFAAFEITDIYNNTTLTELTAVDPRVYSGE